MAARAFPVPMLGTVQQTGDVPGVFDIAKHEKETHGRVDNIIFQGRPDSRGDAVERSANNLYAIRLRATDSCRQTTRAVSGCISVLRPSPTTPWVRSNPARFAAHRSKA